MNTKKPYIRPELTVWGDITTLTATGLTNPGQDTARGSIVRDTPNCGTRQTPQCPS